MSPQEIQTVQVRPGISVTEVERVAALHLNYSTLFDNSALVIDRPIRITYADRQHGFELPPSHVVWLSQRAGIITGIETTTALAYMDLQSAHETALVLMERLRTAGWTPTGVFANDLATIEDMNRQKLPGEEFRKLYGTWQLATVSAEVYVKEHSSSPGGLADAQFLSGIDIMDWSLHNDMERKMFDRREVVNGSINKSLPLSEWVQ